MTDRARIGPGFRAGNLTVVSATDRRKNGYTIWLCRCDCANTIELDTRTLQRGTVRDCGCRTKVNPGQRDIAGQRFGRLTAIEPTDMRNHNGATVWSCRCDCGNEVYAPISQLTHGYKKSCGCLGKPPLKDYTGRRFGQLTVLRYWGKRNGMHRWECRCDCGNIKIVGQTLLQTGKTKSCGCLQASVVLDTMKFVDGTSVTKLEKSPERLISTNTSGYNGVHWSKSAQRWVAQIGFKGKTYYLGSFKEIGDAVDARKKAEEQIYGAFLEWYYSQKR